MERGHWGYLEGVGEKEIGVVRHLIVYMCEILKYTEKSNV